MANGAESDPMEEIITLHFTKAGNPAGHNENEGAEEGEEAHPEQPASFENENVRIEQQDNDEETAGEGEESEDKKESGEGTKPESIPARFKSYPSDQMDANGNSTQSGMPVSVFGALNIGLDNFSKGFQETVSKLNNILLNVFSKPITTCRVLGEMTLDYGRKAEARLNAAYDKYGPAGDNWMGRKMMGMELRDISEGQRAFMNQFFTDENALKQMDNIDDLYAKMNDLSRLRNGGVRLDHTKFVGTDKDGGTYDLGVSDLRMILNGDNTCGGKYESVGCIGLDDNGDEEGTVRSISNQQKRQLSSYITEYRSANQSLNKQIQIRGKELWSQAYAQRKWQENMERNLARAIEGVDFGKYKDEDDNPVTFTRAVAFGRKFGFLDSKGDINLDAFLEKPAMLRNIRDDLFKQIDDDISNDIIKEGDAEYGYYYAMLDAVNTFDYTIDKIKRMSKKAGAGGKAQQLTEQLRECALDAGTIQSFAGVGGCIADVSALRGDENDSDQKINLRKFTGGNRRAVDELGIAAELSKAVSRARQHNAYVYGADNEGYRAMEKTGGSACMFAMYEDGEPFDFGKRFVEINKSKMNNIDTLLEGLKTVKEREAYCIHEAYEHMEGGLALYGKEDMAWRVDYIVKTPFEDIIKNDPKALDAFGRNYKKNGKSFEEWAQEYFGMSFRELYSMPKDEAKVLLENIGDEKRRKLCERIYNLLMNQTTGVMETDGEQYEAMRKKLVSVLAVDRSTIIESIYGQLATGIAGVEDTDKLMTLIEGVYRSGLSPGVNIDRNVDPTAVYQIQLPNGDLVEVADVIDTTTGRTATIRANACAGDQEAYDKLVEFVIGKDGEKGLLDRLDSRQLPLAEKSKMRAQLLDTSDMSDGLRDKANNPGMEILRKHGFNPCRPFHCKNDGFPFTEMPGKNWCDELNKLMSAGLTRPSDYANAVGDGGDRTGFLDWTNQYHAYSKVSLLAIGNQINSTLESTRYGLVEGSKHSLSNFYEDLADSESEMYKGSNNGNLVRFAEALDSKIRTRRDEMDGDMSYEGMTIEEIVDAIGDIMDERYTAVMNAGNQVEFRMAVNALHHTMNGCVAFWNNFNEKYKEYYVSGRIEESNNKLYQDEISKNERLRKAGYKTIDDLKSALDDENNTDEAIVNIRKKRAEEMKRIRSLKRRVGDVINYKMAFGKYFSYN